MGKIGDRINDLSAKEIPLKLYAGGEEFNLIFNPVPEKKLILNATEYASAKVDNKEDNISFSEEMVRYLASACLRDEKGNPVWEKPEDIKVNDLVFNQLQTFMLKHVLGDMIAYSSSLSEVETKK